MMGAPASRSGSRASHEAATASSPKASIPSAQSRITQPFTVAGFAVTPRMIAGAIDRLANVADGFAASAVGAAIFPEGEPFVHARSEALNRLFQRWRNLGLVSFRHGRWWMARGAWDKMQASAIEARRAETTKIGSVEDESAVAESQTPKGEDRA